LQQQLLGKWKLFSSYSHTVRFPTLHHLYSQTSGNSKLQPEFADKFELGINKIFFFSNRDQYCSVDLALFYNKMSDMIYRATRSLHYINVSQATTQGVEVRTNWSLSQYLGGEFSYSFIDFPQSVLEITDYLPANKLRFMLTGKTGFGTTLNYEVAYVDDRQFYYTSNFVLTLPDYFIHNLNFIQEVTKKINARLEVSNLLDNYYEEEFGYPQPGRQIMGGIRLSF
ncbi:MAG: TonB-dependent receptor, partial [bacterium]